MIITAFSHHVALIPPEGLASHRKTILVFFNSLVSSFNLELVQRVQENTLKPNLPIEHIKREPLVLIVQTGQAAKYRSTRQTVSEPSSHN